MNEILKKMAINASISLMPSYAADVGTSDKPKDKKPENVKSRKPVRK